MITVNTSALCSGSTEHVHISVILHDSTRKKRLNPFPRGVNYFAPRSHRAIHGRALVPTQPFTVQGPTYPHWMDGTDENGCVLTSSKATDKLEA